jgi:hypothetical protein
MAPSFYKWLLFPLLGLVLSSAKAPAPHPFHVSVVEINHNPTDKNLEISCKIFTDDFEKVLRQNYKTRIDIINPSDRATVDKLVSDYIRTHLVLKVDGKPAVFSYLGYEREDDAIYSYVEVPNTALPKTIDITNKLMYDLFDDQTNLVHVLVGGNRKSGKLEYPKTEISLSF